MLAINGKRGAGAGALLIITCVGLAAAGCGSSSPSSSGGKTSGGKASGTVSLAAAASLEYLNQNVVAPAFTKADGYAVSGRYDAAGDLSSDIASGEITPNVFESVGADNITPLEPKFTKWYIQYAGTAMVVAYNPKSKYASQFKAFASGKKPLKDLFTLMETPGFKLGRTDPAIDPQGRDFIYMLELAQKYYHLPSDTVTKILGGPAGSSTSSQIYAESSLDATLESGQLDASSAFIHQAVELHLDYIKLPVAINLSSFADSAHYGTASVTVTIGGVKTTKTGSAQVIDITIIGKPTPAAVAFVKYTLSKVGLSQYEQGGLTLLTPTATGSGVPAAISSELGS